MYQFCALRVCVDYQLCRGDFLIAVGQTITDHSDTDRGADLFNVALHNHIAELFVQLNGVADAVCLLAGNQRGATATKRVKHQRVCHAGVHDRICQKWDRLHGRMVTVFLRLIKFPDGGFLAACVPLMLTGFLPAEQHRLMLLQVTGFGEGRLLKFCLHIKIVIMDAFLGILTEQGLKLRWLEAGERNIEVGALQISD